MPLEILIPIAALFGFRLGWTRPVGVPGELFIGLGWAALGVVFAAVST